MASLLYDNLPSFQFAPDDVKRTSSVIGLLGTGEDDDAPSFDFAPDAAQQKRAMFDALGRMGAAMLQNNRGGWHNALGAGFAAHADGYQRSLDQAREENINRMKVGALKDDWQAKQQERKRAAALREAMGQLDPSAPDYYVKAAKLSVMAGDIDNAKALAEIGGGKPTDAQRNFQFLQSMGVPPEKAMQVFTPFAPPSMQYVQGNESKPAGVFDPRSGQFYKTEQPQPQEPVDNSAPWNGQSTVKARDAMRTRVYEADSKKLEEMRAERDRGRAIMRDLERFGELNRETSTGSWNDKINPWTTDSNKQEMEAIIARNAPNMRPAGSGATSDKDMGLYLRGLPGLDKDGSANKAIRDQYAKQLSEYEKRFAFAERMLMDRGHLNGLDQAYRQANRPTANPAQPRQAPTPKEAFGSVVSRNMVVQAAQKADMSTADMEKALRAKGVRIQ